jgi:hypothetical protein
MNILPRDQQVEIIAALCEGVSIRAVERLTDVHRDTIMRLGARVGMGCAKLHDATMRDLRVPRIELDEAWSFVAKKQARVKPEDGRNVGDQYVFIALAGAAKGILSYRVGKRDAVNTRAFLADLRDRVLGAPEIFGRRLPSLSRSRGLSVRLGLHVRHHREALQRRGLRDARGGASLLAGGGSRRNLPRRSRPPASDQYELRRAAKLEFAHGPEAVRSAVKRLQQEA